jgi:hypothetical protein
LVERPDFRRKEPDQMPEVFLLQRQRCAFIEFEEVTRAKWLDGVGALFNNHVNFLSVRLEAYHSILMPSQLNGTADFLFLPDSRDSILSYWNYPSSAGSLSALLDS